MTNPPAAAAKAAYDALAEEYESAWAALQASRISGAARYTALTHMSYVRRSFRMAQLTAPAEGEERSGFDQLMNGIRDQLAQVRSLIEGV